MSILDTISHSLNEHHTRALREGRALEANFVALIKEIVMSSVQDLQGKINTQGDKLSQLEADVRDLVGKAGGTAPASGPGISVTQDQIDTMAQAIDRNNERIDALKDHVVKGGDGDQAKTGSPISGVPPTPKSSTPDTPVVPPPTEAQNPTNMNPETNSNNAGGTGGVQVAPINNPTPPPPPPPIVTPGPGPTTAASTSNAVPPSPPSAVGGVTSGNADTPQSTPPVTPPNNAPDPSKPNG